MFAGNRPSSDQASSHRKNHRFLDGLEEQQGAPPGRLCSSIGSVLVLHSGSVTTTGGCICIVQSERERSKLTRNVPKTIWKMRTA